VAPGMPAGAAAAPAAPAPVPVGSGRPASTPAGAVGVGSRGAVEAEGPGENAGSGFTQSVRNRRSRWGAPALNALARFSQGGLHTQKGCLWAACQARAPIVKPPCTHAAVTQRHWSGWHPQKRSAPLERLTRRARPSGASASARDSRSSSRLLCSCCRCCLGRRLGQHLRAGSCVHKHTPPAAQQYHQSGRPGDSQCSRAASRQRIGRGSVRQLNLRT
jgi:hypothetical protein